MPRTKFLAFFVQRPAATVVMEACGSAHHGGRQLRVVGHQVVLLPAHQVRSYVLRNKTDRTDAMGLLEAYCNGAHHPVPRADSYEHHVTAGTWSIMAARTAFTRTLTDCARTCL